MTVEAILEAPPDDVAHALVHVYEDRVRIEGYGRVTSRDLALQPWEEGQGGK